ncbi:MAG: rhomboid family intramembrane serine protease [Bacteroidales bacterium]|nr:rhomboid family intramembrane serine protease [Bacteroidales bacterium]
MNPMFGNRGYGYNRPNFGDTMKVFFAQKSALNYLLIANVGIWIMVAMVNVVAWLFKSESVNILVRFMALPSSLQVLATKPWTAITYMFLHERFWHLFFNVWMLYFGGMIFVRFLSDKKLIWTYVIGGLFGALFFVLAYNVFPVFEDVKQSSFVMGASASVLAILVAAASYKPDYELNLLLFGRLKFKWLAIIFVVIDLLSISAENPGGHIAHLGGALYGFLYGFLMRKDFDFGKIFRFPKRSGMKYTRYKTVKDEPKRPVSDEQYNQQQVEKERDVDAILDKIAKNGYTSLTQDEKDFLFKNSR